MRKYFSLIPYIQQAGYTSAVVVGGSSSNNLCGISQLLIQSGITPYPLSMEPRGTASGNAYLSELLIPKSRWKYLSRVEWRNVDEHAQEYAEKIGNCIVIPEGGNHPGAEHGAQTLGEDIAAKISPDHIFIDSGTGFQARALIESCRQHLPNVHIHVVLVAGTPFPAGDNVFFYTPKKGASFGSTPRIVCDEVVKVAREEGFFIDPIYTAKLFMTARDCTHLKGTKCIIHSGGGIGLFQCTTKVLESAENSNTAHHNRR